jgi:hypothetical protein
VVGKAVGAVQIQGRGEPQVKRLLVPVMIAVSGAFMASAWLAHLRFRDRIGFGVALLASWAIVPPNTRSTLPPPGTGSAPIPAPRWQRFILRRG